MGFFSNFGYGFEAGHEIGNDLEGEKDGKEWSGAKGGVNIGERAVSQAKKSCDGEENENGGGDPALKSGGDANAAIVEKSKKEGERNAQEEAGQKNRLASDVVEFEGIERGKKISGELADGDGFPRANDEVGEKHDPTGEIANERRKNQSGIGGFAGSVGKTLDPFPISVADGEKNQATEGESKGGAKRTTSAEPVVHEDEPANSDHGAKAEGEVVVEAEFAGEGGHGRWRTENCSREDGR